MFKLDKKLAIQPQDTRSAMQMNARARIRRDSIEQAHRALSGLPEHQPEDLTKTQAIQMLIAPIRASQSKGYSLAAIGKVLSECGIPITTGALRAYVSDASTGEGRKKRSKAKRAARAAKETRTDGAGSGRDAAPAQPPRPAATPSVGAARSTVTVDREPAARSDKVAPARPGASRSGFEVQPDAEDL